jgi:hypothetical protein
MTTQYRPIQIQWADLLGGGLPHWRHVTAVTLFLITISISVLPHASDDEMFSCAAYYGLNVCASTFDLHDDQLHYTERDKNVFDAKGDKKSPPPETKHRDDDINNKQKEDAFNNADSFRDYMKTIETPDPSGTSSEFSVKKKILDSTTFGLDCRLVTNSIYEVSNSNYYDCALQRYF